jgi:ribosomal protein S6
MIVYYEMLVLLRPDIAQDVYDEIKAKIEQIIVQENVGEIKNYDKWGKYLLAYPVQKCAYGIYVFIRFGIENSKSKEVIEKIKGLCKVRFNNFIMRYVFINLGATISSTYCRPDSLEDAPRRDRQDDEGWSNSHNRRHNKNNSDIKRGEIDFVDNLSIDKALEENVIVEGTI